MFAPEARNFRVLPPPPSPAHRLPTKSIARVPIGTRHTPGTVVRLPAEGIYYECAPVETGRDMTWLQTALLVGKVPRPAPPVTRLGRLLAITDRAVASFTTWFNR